MSITDHLPHSQRPEIVPLAVDQVTAATLLSLSVKTLQRRTADGTIPAVKVAGRTLYRVESLKAWLRRQERASVPA